MYQVEIYGRIRRAVLVEGRSQRSVAREFGLARVTVRKMLGYSIPPGSLVVLLVVVTAPPTRAHLWGFSRLTGTATVSTVERMQLPGTGRLP